MTEQTLRPYSPTWRDKLGSYLYDMTSKSPEARNFVGGLVGSRGLGTTGMSVADATPLGMGLQFQEAAQNGDAKGMALAAIPMPMKAGAGMVKRAAEEIAAEAPHIIAYHGSPHSFDRFDMSKIGTGEGAQAYGHGLYFAEAEPVAETYRYVQQPSYTGLDPHAHATRALKSAHRAGLSGEEAKKAALGYLNEYAQNAGQNDLRQQYYDAINNFDDLTGNKIGSMYQVRINADPEHFLDWDKPLSEQPVVHDKLMKYVFGDTAPTATSAVEARGGASIANQPTVRNPSATAGVDNAGISVARAADGPTLFNDYTFGAVRTQDGFHPRVETPSGQRIYRDVTLPSRAEAEAAGRSRVLETVARPQNVAESQFLNAAGIPGIKYLDQGSRSAGEGSRNYVVFDDNLIEILKKYGLAGLLAGGGGMGMMQPEDAQAQTR